MWADPRTDHPVDCDPLACPQCEADDAAELLADAVDCDRPEVIETYDGVRDVVPCRACERCDDSGVGREPSPIIGQCDLFGGEVVA